jgi:hypothetical protein
MTDLTDIIAGGIQDTQLIKPEFGMGFTEGSIMPFFTPHPIESFSIYVVNQYIKSRSLGSSFILGNMRHGWVGYSAASAAVVGSQPFLGASYTDWSNVYSKIGSSGSMVFTDVGKSLVADFACGNPNVARPSYMKFGSDGTVPTATDTDLGSEFVGAMVGLADTLVVDNVSQSEYILLSSVPSSTVVLRELGIFTGSPTGSMIAHLVFPAFTKTNEVEMQNLVEFHVP